MKIIAFYLPQFHEIPENNEMWGKGFTEWTNVKKAKPLFPGHEQPVEPLNDNYYSLLDNDVLHWQVDLANKYGIFGFCFYHYWYNGHLLLEKPLKEFLKDSTLNLPYCICWANHSWTSSWANKQDDIFFQQNYNDSEDWERHFYFFLPFFKDSRYMKNNGKPLLVIYQVEQNSFFDKMIDTWQKLAIKNGLPGIEFAYQIPGPDYISNFSDSRFTYDIEYQPMYARIFGYNNNPFTKYSFLTKISKTNLYKRLSKCLKRYKKESLTIYDYDDLWAKIINMKPMSSKSIPGAFVRVDTTPRRQERGIVSLGMTPEKFKEYLKIQIERAKNVYKSEMLFLFAWNEWAEGAYIEPDKRWGYGSLEAIKQALEENNEFPEW